LRIAQFVETLEAGGAEGLAVDFANSMAARGHEAHTIVLRGDGPFRSRISDSVKFMDLEREQASGSVVYRISHFRKTYLKLAQYVREQEIEVIQTHLPRANFLGLFLSRLHSVRVFPTVHNNREFDYGAQSAWYMEFARKRAYRQMLKWCSGMIAVSDQVRLGMISELGLSDQALMQRIVVAPNGVAIPKKLNSVDRARVRNGFGVPDQDLLVVAVGRLSRQKNFGSLVRALGEVDRSFKGWRCIIAGEGEERESIQESIEALGLAAKITMPGHVEAVSELMAAADVFCLSSRFEGLPLVLLEAMAAGVPVCAYAIPGVAEIVKDGREALLVEPENHREFGLAIAALAVDEDRRCSMGDAGKALIAASYSFDQTIDCLLEIYSS
jgi:glycosyltransferase involved in cell wall biosynthesis